MKKHFTFIFLLFSVSAIGQDVQWFEAGQQWYYRVFCFFEPDCGYINYGVMGNENIGDEDAAVLLRSELQEGWNEALTVTSYLRHESDTVWRYSTEAEEWHMLYDMGATPGDVWTIQDDTYFGYGPDQDQSEILLFKVVVDSVDFWEDVPNSDLQNRRIIYTSPYTDDSEFSYFSYGGCCGTIIEGIGAVDGGRDLIGNPTETILPPYQAQFQCFLNNGALQYGSAESPCNVLSAKGNALVESVAIYPNPATDIIKLNGSIDRVAVIDATGMTVFQQRNSISGELNIGFLSSGMYTVVITNKTGIFTQKIVVR